MRNIFIKLCIILLLSGCNTKSVFEKDGGIIVSLSFDPGDYEAKNELKVIKKRIQDCQLEIEESKIDSVNKIITLKVPLFTDSALFVQLLNKSGLFSIYECYENSEIAEGLYLANNVISSLEEFRKVDNIEKINVDNEDISLLDRIKNSENKANDSIINKFPLYSIFKPNISNDNHLNEGPLLGFANQKDTSLISQYLHHEKVKVIFPKNVTFCWSLNSSKFKGNSFYELYAVKYLLNGSMQHINKNIKRCEIEMSQSDYSISISFDQAGAKRFSIITRNNIAKYLPIIIDNRVIMCPKVMSEIKDGNIQISMGSGNISELKVFRSLLKNSCEIKHTRIYNIKVIRPKRYTS